MTFEELIQLSHDQEIIIDRLQDVIEEIYQWIDAYPLSAFPEPDFKAVRVALKAEGLTLDAVSASNMRHVLEGIKKIIDDNYKQESK